MKVLFISRAHIGLSKGGLQMQIHRTADGLRQRGIEVVLYDPWTNQIEDVDVVHVFCSFDHMYYHVVEAARLGKPVVFSPVFGYCEVSPWRARLEGALAKRLPGFLGNFKRLQRMLQLSDAIIALNAEEAQRMSWYFTVPRDRLVVIPNGVDEQFTNGDPSVFEQRYGFTDFVLQVGSIDANKNQLLAIQAMKGLPYKLVIVGAPLINQASYIDQCKAAAGDNVVFTGKLAFTDPLLPSAYAAARVFVLPSFSEVMPLCLYEASAAGCQLMASRNIAIEPGIRDYVKTFSPKDPAQLRGLIEEAMTGDPAEAARKTFSVPSWQDVADRVIDVYESVLASGAKARSAGA